MRLLIVFFTLLISNSVLAQETVPGDACTAGETNFIRRSGGPETSGVVHLMRCDGTIWQPYLTFLGDGKAGIGTDTPTAMLHVDGDLRIGTTSDNCSVSKEGAIRYTGGSPPWEYCDGGGPGWLPFEQAAVSCGFSNGTCPTSNSSISGCFSQRTLSWGNVSCSTSGPILEIIIDQPLVDGLMVSGTNLAAARAAAQHYCADISLTWISTNTTTTASAPSYWAPRIDFDPSGYYARSANTDVKNTNITCASRL